MRSTTPMAAIFLGLLAQTATALSIEPAVAPFHDNLGHRGTYTFFAVGNGLPVTANVLVGEVMPTDVTVVFRIQLDAESVEMPNFLVQAIDGSDPLVPLTLVGGGVLAIGGRAVSTMGIGADASGRPVLSWLFDGPLLAGENSVLLFASWSRLQSGDHVGAFLETRPPRDPLFPGAPVFGRRDFFGGTVVPEPGTALLVGLGLALTRSARRTPR